MGHRPPSSTGHPPSEHGAAALDAMATLLAGRTLPLVEEFEREHGDTTFLLEPDGRLGAALVELKSSLHRQAAEAGLYAFHLPPPDGLGLSLVDCLYVQEEVFRHGLRGQQWLLAWTDGPSPLVGHWSEASRAEHLPDFLAGRTSVAFAATEPGAGSDLQAIGTEARRDGDDWVIRGTKHLITGAPFADAAQVLARTGDGLSMFLCPLTAAGVTRGAVQQTIMADGQTGPISFDDVRVPASALIGSPGDGLALAFVWINWARTRRGGMCSGLAWHCLEQALAYGRERRAFGRPLTGHGAVATMLADMRMDWEAMRALSLELLARLDRAGIFSGPVSADARRDISVLKAWNDEALYRVADRALQVHGGRGLLTESGLERIFRVARNLRVPAGTVEIQKTVVARALDDGPS